MDFDRALEEPIIEPIIERTKIRDLLKFFIVIPENSMYKKNITFRLSCSLIFLFHKF